MSDGGEPRPGDGTTGPHDPAQPSDPASTSDPAQADNPAGSVERARSADPAQEHGPAHSNDLVPTQDTSGSSGSIAELAAALRRDAADLDLYAQVLSVSLADALPPGSVVLGRGRRSMGDRLAGREGQVERVEVSLEDQRLILTVAHGRTAGEIAKVVRGVVLSRTPVPLEEWTRKLAAAVAQRARSDERARAALEKLLLDG